MIDVIGHAQAARRSVNYLWLNYRWAVRNQVADALPEAVLRGSGVACGKKSAQCTVKATSYREQTANSILKQRIRKILQAAASRPPATEPTTGKDGGQHWILSLRNLS